MIGRADINQVLREVYEKLSQQQRANLIAWTNPPVGTPIWGGVEPAQVTVSASTITGTLPPEPAVEPGDRDWEGMDNTQGPRQWDSHPRAANAALGDAWVAQPQAYPRWGGVENYPGQGGLGR